MRIQLAHKIRLKPNKNQLAYFNRASGVARFTYNWALAEWQRQYEAGGFPSIYGLKKEFNAIKRDKFPFVMEVHRDCTSQPFFHLGRAFASFFRRLKKGVNKPGYPRFKSKKRSRPSFYIANDKLRVEGKRIRIPRLGWVKLAEPLRFAGKIMGATVGRDGNHWFVSIGVDIGEVDRFDNGQPSVGIDLGIYKLMTLSDGVVAENQRYTLKHEKRLRRLNKKLARQVKGSNNWWKTVYKLRQLHSDIRNRRQDWLHKWTSYIASHYGLIGLENLNTKGMLQNHRLAKHLADVAFGEITRQLEYKQHLYGSRLQKIDRWFPSSQLCADCGNQKPMPQGVVIYECHICGMVRDRDENAAINIKREAVRLAQETPSPLG